jgi:sec-independent protein translocase protein TatA
MHATPPLAFLPNVGWPELLILGVILLLLFGRRLPEVARNLGQGIVQFKKGLREIDADANSEAARPPVSGGAARPPLTSGEDRRVSHGGVTSDATTTPHA